MNDLTRAMQDYRRCLLVIWNDFLAPKGNWDERDYFNNAAVELFRAMVLYYFTDEIRDSEILPMHRADMAVFAPLKVKTKTRQGILMSLDGSFADTQDLSPGIDLEQVDMRYFELFDFMELGIVRFQYVKVEIVASPIPEQIGVRLLIPFENTWFEAASPDMLVELQN